MILSLLFLPGAKRLHPQDVLTRSEETRRNLLVSGSAESGCESVTALRFADGIFNIFFHHYSKTAQRYEKKMIYTNIYHFFKTNGQKLHVMRQFVAFFTRSLLVLADEFDGQENQPVRGVLQYRRTQPVDETRSVCFPIAEHLSQGPFDQFLRRDRHRQVDR